MCRRVYKANNKPEYKNMLNLLMELKYAGNTDIAITTCRKANRIEMTSDRPYTIYTTIKNLTNCSAREFMENWKAA